MKNKRGGFFSISFKCPRCFKEVPDGNRFCIFCGQEISAARTGGQKLPNPVSLRNHLFGNGNTNAAPDLRQEEPRPVSQSCPNGHEVADASLGFCPVCGVPLVNGPHNGRR